MKETYDILNKGKEKKDPSRITMDAVRKWFKLNKETLKAPTGSNSFVAPAPLHEFQVDLFHFKYTQPERVKVAPEQPPVGPRLKNNALR